MLVFDWSLYGTWVSFVNIPFFFVNLTSFRSPCTVNEEGTDTTINKYSWNDKANVIFLDQVRKTYVIAFIF
jgi:hypothetical protein